jgi:uncharacterized membrane protein
MARDRRRERAARRDRDLRLDTPLDPRRRGLRPRYDAESFGRLSEGIARFLGTGRFLVIQTVFIACWILINVIPGIPHFDPYTFTFLTLILSLQAAYAAPLILLAQNRQDDRDRVNLEQDRRVAVQQREDVEYLARELAALRIAVGEVATRDFLRSELRTLREDLEAHAEDIEGRPRDGKAKPRRKKERPSGEQVAPPEPVTPPHPDPALPVAELGSWPDAALEHQPGGPAVSG